MSTDHIENLLIVPKNTIKEYIKASKKNVVSTAIIGAVTGTAVGIIAGIPTLGVGMIPGVIVGCITGCVGAGLTQIGTNIRDHYKSCHKRINQLDQKE